MKRYQAIWKIRLNQNLTPDKRSKRVKVKVKWWILFNKANKLFRLRKSNQNRFSNQFQRLSQNKNQIEEGNQKLQYKNSRAILRWHYWTTTIKRFNI